MQEQYMMVNPNDLVIDLPVDEAHVNELMESLQRNGRMVEPVTVWLTGMRIINGFHRTEAAKRLGWLEMPCLVQDLTEDEFWDARIIAAKPHKEIEPARMAAWMLESWRNTFGTRELDIDALSDALKKLGIDEEISDEQLQMFALIDAFDSYEFNESDYDRRSYVGVEKAHDGFTKSGRKRFITRNIWKKRDATEFELWFEGKAQRWGVSLGNVVNSIEHAAKNVINVEYSKCRWPRWRNGAEWRDDKTPLHLFVARTKANERYAEYTPQWFDDVISGKATFVDLHDYYESDRLKREDEERKRLEREHEEQIRRESEVSQREQEREKDREFWRQYREQQAKSIQGRYKRLEGALTDARANLSGLNVADIPEAPALLAEFSKFVLEYSNNQFPDVDIAKPNPVSLENSRIRAENARLKERIASLERALGSKHSAGDMIAKAVAWSSTDLDGANA